MAPYDANLEGQLAEHRRRKRLLVAKRIHFRAPRAEFKRACRSKLTEPNAVQIFWHDGDASWKNHGGCAMLAFETRVKCRAAEAQLEGFEFKGRKIEILRARRDAHPPMDLTTHSAGVTANAPTAAASASASASAAVPSLPADVQAKIDGAYIAAAQAKITTATAAAVALAPFVTPAVVAAVPVRAPAVTTNVPATAGAAIDTVMPEVPESPAP